jgi:hypothetical protein
MGWSYNKGNNNQHCCTKNRSHGVPKGTLVLETQTILCHIHIVLNWKVTILGFFVLALLTPCEFCSCSNSQANILFGFKKDNAATSSVYQSYIDTRFLDRNKVSFGYDGNGAARLPLELFGVSLSR